MPHISILWGSAPEPGAESVKYDFPTQTELDAFLLGIAEADGWAGHRQVPDGYIFAECGRCSSEHDLRDLSSGLCIECNDPSST